MVAYWQKIFQNTQDPTRFYCSQMNLSLLKQSKSSTFQMIFAQSLHWNLHLHVLVWSTLWPATSTLVLTTRCWRLSLRTLNSSRRFHSGPVWDAVKSSLQRCLLNLGWATGTQGAITLMQKYLVVRDLCNTNHKSYMFTLWDTNQKDKYYLSTPVLLLPYNLKKDF